MLKYLKKLKITHYLKKFHFKGVVMTIEQCPQMITCDFCGCADYYFGNKRSVWQQAKEMGWVCYKGKHFDTKECLKDYKEKKQCEQQNK